MLLDNQSTVDVFVNSDLLCSIRGTSTCIVTLGLVGLTLSEIYQAMLRCGMTVFPTFLSMGWVIQKSRVSFGSEQGNTFVVQA
jgi:hypothetical protein